MSANDTRQYGLAESGSPPSWWNHGTTTPAREIVGKPMTMICDIEKKCVAIVRFGPSGFITDGQRAGEYFQVTIDPARLSPSKEYIRFGQDSNGNGMGDEIHGWQRCASMCVIEILDDFTIGYGVTEVI